MTSWLPDLSRHNGPRYLAIADVLAADIAAGRLKPGDRLPTHRDLAWRLGVTVGTVTRAYAEAERRGLVAGEVGRGTYIRERSVDTIPPPVTTDDGFVDLARNLPAGGSDNREIAATLAEIGDSGDFAPLIGYAPNLGLPQHREAGAQWIMRSGLATSPAQVAVTAGAQHGMLVALAALTRAGDVVLTEQLTFYGLKSLATLLSLRLHGVAIDEYGLVPDALDAACRLTGAKALYCIPTLHNPTTALMPEARRAEIADVCRRHDVVIIEDDIYGFLAGTAPRPLSSFAPDRAVFVTSLSKAVAPGLRIGYVRANETLIERIGSSLRATTWMAPPVTAEIAARLIRSGQAESMARRMKDETEARQKIAARVLAGADYAAHAASFHIWLKLPEPWRREEFTRQVRRRGVGVAPADVFAVGRAPVPHAVRVGLSAAQNRAQLERALGLIADVLREPPETGNPLM
ncbi:MAG TPA: PLP-dependent aminotransferase family protein [Alphaproteobacteria bacterium]